MFRLAEPQSPRPPEAAAPAAPHVDQASAGEEVNAVLVAVVPWLISVLLHLGLVVLAFFALWSTTSQEQEQEIIVPMVELSETPGAPLQVRTDQRVQERSTRREIVSQQSQSQSQSTLNTAVNTESQLIGPTGASGAAGNNPFGTSVSSGAEFRTTFMGNRGGNARKVAFVIDASGSLLSTFPFVIDELIKTINNLSEKQQFTVIFYQGDTVIEVPVPNRGWKQATGEVKQKVIDWIQPSGDPSNTDKNVSPQGSGNPVAAIQYALRYNPQLVFLLSDDITGQGTTAVDQRRLLNAIQAVNKAGTKICTIQFIDEDPLTALGLKGTMERIAEQTGGTYEFVTGEEFGINRRQRMR